ncbi:MAG: transcriptional repressor LexA [Armatimonadetes bacterium]|nr:transcriptional repressor LexA [Armatimonadota bacterium]
MSKGLTSRQREALEAIREYIARKGYPPSIRELGKILGISSLRGATLHLDALSKKGFIKRESTSRSIRLLVAQDDDLNHVSAPLLGSIAAGLPLLAVENIESYVPVPLEMAANAKELFALKVKGDSMIGDGILDGDTIIVHSQPSADNGEIVAVLIGDEATVKRLDFSTRPARLLASNANYAPIELARDDVRILGKVMGLVRSYGAN